MRVITAPILCFALPPLQAMARGGAAAARGKASKKFELTEEQKQEIREAFDLFDTDGSGMCAGPPGRQAGLLPASAWAAAANAQRVNGVLFHPAIWFYVQQALLLGWQSSAVTRWCMPCHLRHY